MHSIITGGRDVAGSAERAPLVATPIDRLAVGDITVTNSPDRANEAGRFESGSLTEILVKSQVRVLPGTPIEGAKGDPTGMGWSDSGERPVADRSAGNTPTCALAPRDVAAVSTASPDPRTLVGADGRPSIPSSDRVGAKTDGAATSSSVGSALGPDHGCHKSEQAVSSSNSEASPPPGVTEWPEARTSSLVFSGILSGSPVCLSPVIAPETATPSPPRPAVSGAYSAWSVNRACNSLRSTYP